MKVRRVDFYPDDWIAGTLALCHEERSVYISVCAAIWSHGAGPVDESFVRQICPGPHFGRALDKLIKKGKVARIQTETGPKLAQKRAESELERARKRTETSLINGSKGGRPNKLAIAGGFGGEKPIIQQPTINNQHITRASRATSASADFVEWWKAYPHKVGKGAARKAYAKAHAAVGTATLSSAIERYIANKPADRPWCNAATWLNQERWTDEWPAAPSSNGHDPDYLWRARVSSYQSKRFWLDQFGPPPDDPATQAPAEILREFGYIGGK